MDRSTAQRRLVTIFSSAIFHGLLIAILLTSTMPLTRVMPFAVELKEMIHLPPTQKVAASPAKKSPAPAASVSDRKEAKEELPIAIGKPVETAAPDAKTAAAEDSAAMRSYTAELREAIDHEKTYPQMSRARHEQGRVEVGFTVMRDGALIGAHIRTPCSYPRLNDAAVEAVTRVKSFKPLPETFGAAQWEVIVPIEFVLGPRT